MNVTGGAKNIWLFYDASRPVIIKYRDDEKEDTYHYELNLQGDVIAILDPDGNRVVEYTYDAWGNILSITGSEKDTLGQANPLRYRGYVYDHETGLYYCQSRYYDPEIGRWLNADAFASTGQGLLGNNMFAYCGNNPVMYADPSGNLWIEVLLTSLAYGLISAHISMLVTATTGGTTDDVGESYVSGFVLGITGSFGTIGKVAAVVLGSFMTYCDSREAGLDKSSSASNAAINAALNITPGDLISDKAVAMFSEAVFGIGSSYVSEGASIVVTRTTMGTPSEIHDNKQAFSQNVTGVGTIGVGSGIMYTAHSLRVGDFFGIL